MPNKHAWESCIDLSRLPTTKKAQTEQALNWLEKNFPEFNEMVHELQQGQKAGKIKKITAKEVATPMMFDLDTDTLEINFSQTHYLGKDAKIYENSLNELLVHELQHAVQKLKPGYKEVWDQRSITRAKLPQARDNFMAYLLAHNVPQNKLNDYAAGTLLGTPVNLRADILKDPAYQRIAQSTLNAFRADNVIMLKGEDDAMDRTNILSQMLGKSPRQHYGDFEIIQPFVAHLAGPVHTYTTESLESIRGKVKPIFIPPSTPVPPLVSGIPGTPKDNIVKMQHDWDKERNKDTHNISNEEWRLIEEAKAKYFNADAAKTATPAKKKEADALAEKMKKDFNKTAGNDALNEATATDLAQHGLGATANKAKAKNWHLK